MKRKKGRVFTLWILSYLIIFILPIIIGSYYYFHTYQTIKKNSLEQQVLVLDKARNTIDSLLEEAAGITMNLQLNGLVESLSQVSLRSADPYDIPPSANLNLFHLKERLSTFRIANNNILQIYCYFPELQRVLSASTIYSEDLIPYMGDGALPEDIFTHMKAGDLDSQMFVLLSEQNNDFWIGRRLMHDQKHLPQAAAILQVSYDQLLQQFDTVLPYEHASLLITDFSENTWSTGESIAADLRTDEIRKLYREDLLYETHHEIKGLSGTNYIIYSTASELSPLSYISIMEKSQFYAVSHSILRLLIITLSCCMIVGLGLTYLFAYFQYRPIQQMMKYVGIDDPEKIKSNEYHMIINQLFSNQKELETQKEILRNEYMKKLLYGEVSTDMTTDANLKKFEISFPGNQYMIGIIEIHIKKEPGSFLNTDLNTTPYSLLRFVIRNVASELLLSPKYKITFCDIDQQVVFIINDDDLLIDRKVFWSKLDYMVKFCETHYSCQLLIGISDIEAFTASITETFTQAQNALEYIMLFQNKSICSFTQICELDHVSNHYPAGEAQLIQYVMRGEKQLLAQYFSDLAIESRLNNLSVMDAKYYIYFFYHTGMRIKQSLIKKYKTDYPKVIDQINHDLFSQSFQSSLLNIQRIFMEVAAFICGYQSDTPSLLISNVYHYIEHNYFDPDINVNIIGEYFHLTPAYISKKFKEEFGKGIVDALYEIRIKQAIHLLETTNLKVADIAAMVGFQNSSFFIRIFKKQTGITPGKHKEFFLKGGQ